MRGQAWSASPSGESLRGALGNPERPEKFRQIAAPAPTPPPVVKPKRIPWHEVVIVLVLLAVGAGYFLFHRAGPKGTAVPEKSIAVLPLVNSTGDPANEYFSDGMSEEFISSLSRLQELKIVGRTSSFQFKGKTDDSKTIGEKLGVYYLLEGSVRKSADRVRIAVALIKSGDGANVWSDTYDRELKDIFAVQSEIAGAVAKQLKVALLGNNGQTAPLTTAATPSNQNIEAYNALLQGIFMPINALPRITAKRSATTRRRSGSTRVTRSPMRSCRTRPTVWPPITLRVLRRKNEKSRSQKPVPRRGAPSSSIRISPMRIGHKAWF